MQTASKRNGVGASLLRREDDRHLRGRGEFVADIRLPGTQEVVFLRSPHAHARIRGIAVPPEARGRVFTAADLPRIKPIRIVTQATGARTAALAAARDRQGALCRRGDRRLRRADPRRGRRPRRRGHRRFRAARRGGRRAGRAARRRRPRARILGRQPLPGAHRRGRRHRGRRARRRDHRHPRIPHEPAVRRRRWKAAACSPVATIGSTRSWSTPRPRRRTRCASRSAKSSGSSSAASASSRPMSAAGSDRRRGSIRKRSSSPRWRCELDHPVRWIEDRNEHLLTGAHTRDHHYRVTAYADRQRPDPRHRLRDHRRCRRLRAVAARPVSGSQHGGALPAGPLYDPATTARAPIRSRPTRRRSVPIAGSAAPAPASRSSARSTRSRARSAATRSRCASRT